MLEKYENEVLCDVVFMEAKHYDCKVTDDGITNKFMFFHREQKVTLKPLSPKEVDKNQGTLRPKDGVCLKDNQRPKDFEHPKKENDEKESEGGKELLVMSRKVVRKVVLVLKEPLYLLPTNMCFYLFAQFLELPVGFKQMLESFQGVYPKDIPRGLPSIRGIEYQIDFTIGATLPNQAS
ncbi:hypothetical protein CR513_19036, partial [Mucuna pruriens]